MPIDINYDGMRFDAAIRIDLLIDDQLVVETKSFEQLAPVHAKQLITYLRLMKQPVGLLMNFGGETMKEGIRRNVNNYMSPPSSSASPRLRAKSEYGE